MPSFSTDLSVFLEIPPAVQLHILAGVLSLVLTPIVLWRQRRDRLHKVSGYVWVCMMAALALTSFCISGFGIFGPFSPLHGLAILTLSSLFVAIRAVCRGDLVTHERSMRNLATFGLGLPMVLSFLPGRTFSRAFFEANPHVGLWSTAALCAAILLWRFRRTRQQRGFSLLPAEKTRL